MPIINRCPDLTQSPKGFLQCVLDAGHDENPLSMHHIDIAGPVAIGTPWKLNGEHPAELLMKSDEIKDEAYLKGDAAPTKNQVSAVLHALADFSQTQHIVGEEVTALNYAYIQNFGEDLGKAEGLASYFRGLCSYLNKDV